MPSFTDNWLNEGADPVNVPGLTMTTFPSVCAAMIMLIMCKQLGGEGKGLNTDHVIVSWRCVDNGNQLWHTLRGRVSRAVKYVTYGTLIGVRYLVTHGDRFTYTVPKSKQVPER